MQIMKRIIQKNIFLFKKYIYKCIGALFKIVTEYHTKQNQNYSNIRAHKSCVFKFWIELLLTREGAHWQPTQPPHRKKFFSAKRHERKKFFLLIYKAHKWRIII